MFTRRQFVLGSLLSATAHAQQLAHAGWRGNSIAPEAWWRHAAFLRFPSDTTFADVSKTLDNMAEVNADSILLPDLEPTATAPFADRFGTEDELDTLLREASARRMHVLLHMPLPRALANEGEVRFWMTRGIAGFDLGTLGPGEMDAARALRKTLDAFRGDRILMARMQVYPDAAVAGARRHALRDPITLHIVSVDDLASATTTATTAVELPELPAEAAEENEAASSLPGALPRLASLLPLFLTTGAPVLDSRLLQTPRDRAGIRDVLALRSTQNILRTGTAHALTAAQPGLHAWIIQGRSGRDALLLASNTGKEAVTLHLTAALSAHRVAGSYLRPLLRSDNAMGSVNVEEGSLPPGAALLAEVRSDRYTASTVLDPDAPPPGAARHSRRKRRRR